METEKNATEKELQHRQLEHSAIQEDVSEKTVNLPLLPLIAIGLSIIAIAISGWSWSQANQQKHIVDLAEISRVYQEQAKQQALQDGISNEQRGQILQVLQAKMNTLQQVINEYVLECGCDVFVKSAIVGRSENVVDVTREIVLRVDQKIPATATITTQQALPDTTSPALAQ